jgi:hypothetical protein
MVMKRGILFVTLLIALLSPTQAAAQQMDPFGRISVHAFAGSNTGGWSKTEPSTAPGAAPVRYEFSSGAGAGMRLAIGLSPALGVWAAGELNVEQDGVFGGLYGGVLGRTMVTPHAAVQARLGVGRLEHAPVGVAGASVAWFPLRYLSVGLGAEVVHPIGTGRRNNGLQDVEVDYDGGPTRIRLEFGWYPGR